MIKRYDMTDHCGQHMCNCDIAETGTGEYVEYSAYTALLAENAAMREALMHTIDNSNVPEYHCEGMGCGLEDRGITDPYEAMHHGWECAIGRVYSDVIPDAMPETPATSAALAAVKIQSRIEGIEQFIAEMLNRGNDPTNSLTESIRADMRSAAMFARTFVELREVKDGQ